MASLTDAFRQIRSDDALSREFTQDPAGVMERLGVDTSGLKITRTETVQGPGAESAADAAAFCVSIGCVVCASIG